MVCSELLFKISFTQKTLYETFLKLNLDELKTHLRKNVYDPSVTLK